MVRRFLLRFRVHLIVAALSLATLALARHGFVVEPDSLVVREYRLDIPSWPSALDGFRIAAGGDIHGLRSLPMLTLLLVASSPWAVWRPGTCFPDDCFCEAIGAGLVRQPANTWSSFAFVLVAAWVVAQHARSRGDARAALSRAETALLVGSLVLVGVGSAFYHASLTFVGQVIDVSGMYLVATFILLHRLGPRWGISPIASVLGFVLLNASLMTAQVTTPALRRFAFGVLLTTALLVEWRSSRAGRAWLATGAGLMGAAFLIWVVDRQRILCAPESLVQGHAIWHLLGALAAGCLFKSYEKEAGAERRFPGIKQ